MITDITDIPLRTAKLEELRDSLGAALIRDDCKWHRVNSVSVGILALKIERGTWPGFSTVVLYFAFRPCYFKGDRGVQAVTKGGKLCVPLP